MKRFEKLNSSLGEIYIINLGLHNSVWCYNNETGDCMSTREIVNFLISFR